MATVTIDKNKIRNALRTMAEGAFNEFADFAQSFIIEEKRNYPNETVRRYGVGVTGKYANSPRDVVDSGKLRDSKEVNIEYNPLLIKMLLQWTTDHAQIVYGGTSAIPPYPWVALALREFDWEEAMSRHWEDR
jgi:hypothetical protein